MSQDAIDYILDHMADLDLNLISFKLQSLFS